MPKVRKAKTAPPPPKGWIIENFLYISPQVTLHTGDKCKVRGERGVFTFKRHIVNTNFTPVEEWVDVYGGAYGREQYRSLPINKIKHIPKRRQKKKAPSRSRGPSSTTPK